MTQGNAPLPSAILETCLDVTDLPRSRELYAGLFGYSVMQSDDRFCAFSVGGRQVLLLFVRGTDPEDNAALRNNSTARYKRPSARWLQHPSESLPAWRGRLAERGISIESSFAWPTGGTSVYFRDPDGHLLELLTPGVWPIY